MVVALCLDVYLKLTKIFVPDTVHLNFKINPIIIQ